jgi:hypothetical protein
MRGETNDWRKSLYYAYYEFGGHKVPRHFGVRTHTHKLIYFPDTDEWNLFDLKRDPGEMRSVYGEPAYRDARKKLLSEFDRVRTEYDAPAFE